MYREYCPQFISYGFFMTSDNKAKRDENRVTTLIGVSSETTTIGGIIFVTGETPVPVAVNPTTGAILTKSA